MPLLRYNLDMLGWYEFEHLCQTLLKHKLSLGIEAWGGTNDYGRDAYYTGELKYPGNEIQKGPFLFQCKFINGANSASAKIEKPILNAVKKECQQITDRLTSNKWTIIPTVYTFLTNAVLSSTLREKIKSQIKAVLPNSDIVLLGGNDICGFIDLTSGIARKFPQILSLNDLDILLEQCVNRDILNRSEAAIEEAKEISKVFVPTEAYSKAIKTLREHFYVVLEGPPEVGKTAIGRMIALSYLPEGWEVIECQAPNDFLKIYNRTQKQIFITDDSFGRTEYNPERVRLWQDDLPAILRKVNKDHLLIMTSRKHLLEMAKEKLDIPGSHEDFPKLSEVLIDVSQLIKIEKTLMLYKHMKQVKLPEDIKGVVRVFAEKVIMHSGFTPERIRVLSNKVKAEKFSIQLIDNILRNPTDRMSKTYRELPVAYKWFMVSVLINQSNYYSAQYQNTKRSYEKLCPLEELVDFEKIIAQLSEAFIKLKEYIGSNKPQIDWVHPSCGDMVSKELSSCAIDRKQFLEFCGESGLMFAVSVGGGDVGQRVLPLLISSKDWEIFEKRCLACYNTNLLNRIYDSVQQLSKTPNHYKDKAKLEILLKKSLITTIIHINDNGSMYNNHINIFRIVKQYSNEKLPPINYYEAWLSVADSAIGILNDDYKEWHKWGDIDHFISLTKVILEYDPTCFETNNMRDKWQEFIATLIKRGLEVSNYQMFEDDHEMVQELFECYDESSKLFKDISAMIESDDVKEQCKTISNNFNCLMDDISEYLPYEGDVGSDESRAYYDNDFSVQSIFRDL